MYFIKADTSEMNKLRNVKIVNSIGFLAVLLNVFHWTAFGAIAQTSHKNLIETRRHAASINQVDPLLTTGICLFSRFIGGFPEHPVTEICRPCDNNNTVRGLNGSAQVCRYSFDTPPISNSDGASKVNITWTFNTDSAMPLNTNGSAHVAAKRLDGDWNSKCPSNAKVESALKGLSDLVSHSNDINPPVGMNLRLNMVSYSWSFLVRNDLRGLIAMRETDDQSHMYCDIAFFVETKS